MARAVVFVDDAVRGDLPMVCVKTGAPAKWRIWFRGEVGAGTNPLWFLLVFFGPVGWLILLLGLGRGERLDVLLPVSQEAVTAMNDRRRDRRFAIAATALAIVMTFLLARWFDTSLLVPGLLIVAGLVAVFATNWRLSYAGVDIDLDASRRWVTLSGVSREFAAAAQAESRRRV